MGYGINIPVSGNRIPFSGLGLQIGRYLEYTVSQKTSQTFSIVTWNRIIRF